MVKCGHFLNLKIDSQFSPPYSDCVSVRRKSIACQECGEFYTLSENSKCTHCADIASYTSPDFIKNTIREQPSRDDFAKKFTEVLEIEERIAKDKEKWNLLGILIHERDFGGLSIRRDGRIKLLELWQQEFIHRGQTPINARRLADIEMEIEDQFRAAHTAYENYAANMKRVLPNLRVRKMKKFQNRYRFARFFFIFCLMSGLMFEHGKFELLAGIAIASTLVIQKLHEKYIKTLLLSQLGNETILRIERPIEIRFRQVLKPIAAKLGTLPPSQLSKDEFFRELIVEKAFDISFDSN